MSLKPFQAPTASPKTLSPLRVSLDSKWLHKPLHVPTAPLDPNSLPKDTKSL